MRHGGTELTPDLEARPLEKLPEETSPRKSRPLSLTETWPSRAPPEQTPLIIATHSLIFNETASPNSSRGSIGQVDAEDTPV